PRRRNPRPSCARQPSLAAHRRSMMCDRSRGCLFHRRRWRQLRRRDAPPLTPEPWENVLPVMSGKRAFLDLLKQEGVEIMFGNPGTTELPLMDAFATENELRYLLGLQEAAVMAMADGYAQASGKLAVVNLHVTPGLGNAMGMLYDAQKAGSPILVTAGQHEQSFNATEPILWADL